MIWSFGFKVVHVFLNGLVNPKILVTEDQASFSFLISKVRRIYKKEDWVSILERERGGGNLAKMSQQ